MITVLKYDWKFIKAENINASAKEFDDKSWRTVRVPHDYAVEGPFCEENDRQVTEIVADGITEPMVLTGRTGGLPIGEKAWYRRKFEVSRTAKNIFLEFDGVMSNAEVYVNGEFCGSRHYGYSSFSVDITKFIKRGKNNVLAVSVNPENSSSRWYPGAGIYREVRLVEKDVMYFNYCPAYVRAQVKNGCAFVDVDLSVCNGEQDYDIVYEITNEAGEVVTTDTVNYATGSAYNVFKLKEFTCWDVLKPYLYNLSVSIKKKNKIYDTYNVNFGIRTIEYSADKGLFINGNYVKLNGVCMHHDLGPLGAAFNKAAARRQIEKLIGIGVNAYRTSHNPPAPEVLDLCDEYGLLVMDEAFDTWKIQKVNNGYGKYFDTDSELDVVSMIKRDRNHPCIIIWSIGNEILEQSDKDGWKVARYLHNICKKEDPTRPTTAGYDQTISAFKNGLADEVDIAGINYKPHLYESLHKDYPHIPLYGSETSSCVSSRGEFYLPAEIEIPAPVRKSLQVASYDLSAPPWAYYPEREFFAQDKCDYVLGEFVWTGFDYLGEPTPYRDSWPSRSSYFGIFDLVGIEKSRAYSYMCKWTDKKVLYLFPHWNWNDGDLIDVHAYSSYHEVELFLNGKSLGVSTLDPSDEIRKYRHVWQIIPFEAGELKAVSVSYPKITCTVNTAGAPYSVLVEPERTEITADGDDVVFVRCTIVDEKGNLCPTANVKLDFEVSGAGEYLASDAGNAASTRVFSETYCDTFNGMCMAVIRSIKDTTGEITLKVSAENMADVSVNIKAN